VQNMGGSPANIEIKYMAGDGSLISAGGCPQAGVCDAIPAGGGWTFVESQNGGLPAGYLGSAVIVSDQPIAVLFGKDSDRGGGYFQTAGDTVALSAGSGKLFLPIVIDRDGPAQNWDARFAIQNMGDSTACATLVYLSNYTDSEVRTDPAAGAAPLAGCPNGGIPIPANGTLFRSFATMGVGPSFTGSVRVDLQKNGQGVQPAQQSVVASAEVYSTTSRHFASYSGLTTNEMGTSLLLPLVERTASGRWSTDFEIMNSDPSQPANVTLRIEGWDGNNQYVVKESSFTVNASRICFQDSDWANCLSPGDTLPQNFHDGVARITSTKPVGVIVSRSTNADETYTSYRAITVDSASQKVFLPLVNKNSPTGASRTGWNSWVRVMVADGGWANVTVRYIGTGGEFSYTTPLYRAATFIQPWESVLPDGFVGSAIIESDRPIVALGNVTAGAYAGDTELIYNGVPQ